MNENDTISSAILEIAKKRGPDKSTCPSEIARLLFPSDWRRHMQDIRDIAICLDREGKVRITQKGIPIDTNSIKGPIRIKITNVD